MMRKFFQTRFMMPLVASAALALVGCSGSGGDDEDTSPTEVPATPTPTPTPEPFSDWFRVTEMLVGDSSEGVDIDGDGSVDNNIEDTLAVINETIVEALEPAICSADGEPACSVQETSILNGIKQVLNAVLSVESLSNAVNGSIQDGTRNYLLNFDELTRGGDVNLTWGLGEFKNTGYTVETTLGEQLGSISGGAGRFGPGDLSLSFSFTNPQSGDELFSFELVLHQGYTEVADYNATRLTDVYTGGAISMDDLLAFVETLLVQVNEILVKQGQDPLPIDEYLASIEAALSEYSDITLTDGSEAFSIGLVVQADTVAVVQ